jgi:hypothetical protein
MPSLHIQNLLIQQAITRFGMPGSRSTFLEHHFDLFKGLPCCLGISEESLDCSADAEDAKDDEEFPGYILESGWDEEADCEIEEPVDVLVREAKKRS